VRTRRQTYESGRRVTAAWSGRCNRVNAKDIASGLQEDFLPAAEEDGEEEEERDREKQKPLANKGGQQERGLASLVPSTRTATVRRSKWTRVSLVRHKVEFFNCKSGTRTYFELVRSESSFRPRECIFQQRKYVNGKLSFGERFVRRRTLRLLRCVDRVRKSRESHRESHREGVLSVLSFALCFPANPRPAVHCPKRIVRSSQRGNNGGSRSGIAASIHQRTPITIPCALYAH